MRALLSVLVAFSLVVAGCASTPGPDPDPSIPDEPNGSSPPEDTDDDTAASGGGDLSELFNRSMVTVRTPEKSYERHPHHPEHAPLSQQVIQAALNITGGHEDRSTPLQAAVEDASVVLLRTNQTHRDLLEAHADDVPGHLLWVGIVLEVHGGPLPVPSVLLCGLADEALTCWIFDTEHDARSTLDLANRLGPEILRYEADPLALKDRFLDQGYLHVRVPYLETVNVTGQLEEQTTEVCTAGNTSDDNRSRSTSCQPRSSWITNPGAVAGEPEGSAYLFMAEAYLSGTIRLPGYDFEISAEPIDDRTVTVTVVGENTSWTADT